jgi:tyrosyl-tRNA synthetase
MQRYDHLFFKRSQESWKDISPKEFLGFLQPKAKDVLTWNSLEKLLSSGRKLNIKFGIDPTASDIHLGHLVPIMILKAFQRAGHKIHFIIGDFTARVGDPSGRETARKPLTIAQIKENQKTYLKQISRFFDVKKIKTYHNGDWLSKMNLSEWFSIIQQVPLSDATQREDFRARLRNKAAVSVAEACYGILMAVDSVKVKADVEVGGVDQLLNFQQCRLVMKMKRLPEEAVITTPILEGLSGDGKKMSKSLGNYIAVTATASDKFGKVMSAPDSQVLDYFRFFADVHERDIPELEKFIADNPMEAKKQAASFLVALEAGEISEGDAQRANWERIFSKHEVRAEDAHVLPFRPDVSIFTLLAETGRFESRSAVRRLFAQKAVRQITDGGEEKILVEEDVASLGMFLRAGKKDYFRVQ